MIDLVKERWEAQKDSFFLAFSLFLGVVLIMGLLRLGMLRQDRNAITLQEAGTQIVGEEDLADKYLAASGLPGLVVASRNGTRYYYPWCGGFSRIKEANKVLFQSIETAEKAGYTIASGCEGL